MRTLLLFLLVPISLLGQQSDPSQIIRLNAEYDSGKIIFRVDTDITLPIEVMIGIGLKDSKPDDPAIGFSKRVSINEKSSEFTFDAVNSYGLNSEKLDDGLYTAELNFYPSWGAKSSNQEAKKLNKISVEKDLIIGQISSNNRSIDKQKKQQWAMEIPMKAKWNKSKFTKNLGDYEEIKTKGRDPNVVKTYYFPEADITFFISKPLNQVLMWKIGKTNKL